MDDKKIYRFKTTEVLLLMVITFVLSFVMAFLILKSKNSNLDYMDDEQIKYFVEQYNYIINNYWQSVDEKVLIDGAIEGMIKSLEDPYATYFNETETNNFNIRLDGTYEGIGIEIVQLLDGNIYVIGVLENSSAYESGIKIGDIIVSINNISVSDLTNEQFLQIIKDSNEIFIQVIRDDQKHTFELKKSIIDIQSVHLEQINDKIGYIKIDIFANNTSRQFKEALNQLEQEKILGLIIDLRDNAGGHLTVAEEILSMFLNKDKVIYQIEDKTGIQEYYAKGTENKSYKIAILINNNSASASELVASALKEQLDALLIGQTTYGKGSVQELVKLNSNQQYKFTTKKWLTSKGNYIDGVGVEPDIKIDDSNDDNDNTNIYIEKAIESFNLN